jgi:hypothetical protein
MGRVGLGWVGSGRDGPGDVGVRSGRIGLGQVGSGRVGLGWAGSVQVR